MMQTTKLNTLCLQAFIGLLLVGTITVPANAAADQLEYDDFREALKQAREKDVPLIVHFYTQWCGPCQTMDRTVFSSRQLKDVLAGKVILVKVDAEQSPNLAKMYRVTQYPTDLFLDPNGRILSRSAGMMSLSDYMGLALQVEGRYQQSKKLFVARRKSGNDPSPMSSLQVKLGEPAPFPRELTDSMYTKKDGTQPTTTKFAPDPRTLNESRTQKKTELVFVAIDGYCPVKLNDERTWVRGNKEWIAEYRQQQYYFSGKEQRDLFEAEPQKYAPRLLGCDPVIMWESDRAIPGTTEFAAYYNEKLYLFTNEENRSIFQVDPERYINTRHVLGPRSIEATLIR